MLEVMHSEFDLTLKQSVFKKWESADSAKR